MTVQKNIKKSHSIRLHKYMHVIVVFIFMFLASSEYCESAESKSNITLAVRNVISDPSYYNLIPSIESSDNLLNWTANSGINIFKMNDRSVKVYGVQKNSWDYAKISLSSSTLKAGKYRLEGLMKVDELSASELPFLKVTLKDNSGEFLKAITTKKYELVNPDTWQKLWVEFEIDSDVNAFVAVGKGTIDEIVTTLYISNLSLRKIDDFSEVERLSFSNIPESLKILSGIHPRLYLDRDKIEFLQNKVTVYPYSKFWKAIQKKADKYIAQTPPESIAEYDEETIRSLGNRLPYIALALLITDNEKYLNGLRIWMDALVSYPAWASNKSIGSAHLIFGMSLAYDWGYNSYSSEERNRYQQKINYQAEIFYEALVNKDEYWAQAYIQNGNYVNSMALGIAGFVFYGTLPYAESWIIAAKNNFVKVLKVLSPDGASNEGVAYWSYSMDALFKYYIAFKPVYGGADIVNSSFFQNAGKFRLYSSLPDYKDNVDYGDSPRTDFYGPGYILRALASIFSDGHSQWLAEKIEQKRDDEYAISWLDLLWYDESIESITPDDLPLSQYFENMGILISRSSWSEDAVWSFYKAGPPEGHLAFSKGLHGTPHSHPDAGSFLIWANGQWLVMDDGYVFKKRTDNHNVMIFNGYGQLGEGEKWFNSDVIGDSNIPVLMAKKITDDYQFVQVDLKNIYFDDADVKTYIRTYAFLKHGYVLIKDVFELNTSGNSVFLTHFVDGNIQNISNKVVFNNQSSWVSMMFDSNPKNEVQLKSFSIAETEVNTNNNFSNSGQKVFIHNSNPSKLFNQTTIFKITDAEENALNLEIGNESGNIMIYKYSENTNLNIDFDDFSISEAAFGQ